MRFTLLLPLVALFAATIYAGAEYRSFRAKVAISDTLVKNTIPFERVLDKPERRILVVGDSTGVGVGAVVRELSLAGRLGADYPEAGVTNRAVSGAKVRDVAGQLAAVKGMHFDLVYVQVGGNDIVRFTRLSELENDLAKMIDKAKSCGDQVVVATSGNVGAAPIFPNGLHWLLHSRTLNVRKIFQTVVRRGTVHYVDLFMDEAADPFALEPKRYYAADSFHPSADGYGVWYGEIRDAIGSLPGWKR